MLCAVCVSVFQRRRATGHHHESRAELTAAAKSNCRICASIVQVTGQNKYGRLRFDVSTFPITYVLQYPGDVDRLQSAGSLPKFIIRRSQRTRCRFGRINFMTPTHDAITSFFLWQVNHIVAPPLEYDRYLADVNRDLAANPALVRDDGFAKESIPISTGDPEVAHLAKQWLGNCLHHHLPCQEAARSSSSLGIGPAAWRPKRLIDCYTAHGLLRLVSGSAEVYENQYATLSHCWGQGASFFTLTAENERRISKGLVALSSLPRSFRDAILTCRRLGIRYLWIDSICILQSGDDGRDWTEHANVMSQVYSNCVLNIAIDHAPDPLSGAFSDRDTETIQPCYVSWLRDREDGVSWPYDSKDDDCSTDPDQAISELVTSLVKIYAILRHNKDLGPSLHDNILSSRAWVTQERYLSPRVLHFANDGVYWECLTLPQRTEYMARSQPELSETFQPPYSWLLPPFSHTHPSSFFAQMAPGEVETCVTNWWTSILRQYLQCDITFPDKDRLVAISGVARKFSGIKAANLGPYIAGMFRCTFPWALLWHESQPPTSDVGKFREPSWSWASSNGKLTVRSPNLDGWVQLARLADFSVELVDKNNPYGQVARGSITVGGLLIPVRVGEGQKGFIQQTVGLEVVSLWVDSRFDCSQTDAKLLPLMSNGEHPVHGLLLQETRQGGLYHRVGVFWYGQDLRKMRDSGYSHERTIIIV
ncbi:heterokaryon incompatibility protein-domain-containing protein [Xylariaceae sp. FL1272]|nr:heterokaryon incompatibility protein-domain-containing protein [Xylariaceae sp. FL1272]